MFGFFDLKSTINPDSERKFRVWFTWFFALLILVMMASTSVTSLSRPEAWQFIGAHLNLIYLSSQVITFVTCFVYAIVILLLRSKAASAERWADFIGFAFIVLVLDYLVLFWLGASNSTPSHDWFTNIFSTSLSALSNVLLVAAGLVLLDRDPFPRWNIVMQAVFAASGVILSLQDNRFQRFPDAIASAFCVYWVGYALVRNIRYTSIGFSEMPRKIAELIRIIIGKALMISVLLYALSGFFWASIPFIVEWDWNVRFVTVIEEAARREAAARPKQIPKQIEDKGQGENSSADQVKTGPDRVGVRKLLLDTAVILIFFLLKFVIFLATFFLLLGAIIFVSSQHANEIFDPIVHGAGEYLTDDGVTRLIANRLDTELTLLYVKIPGKRKTLYVKFAWPFQKALEWDRRISESEIESEIDDLALEAMRSGTEQKFSPSYGIGSVSNYFPLAHARRLPTKVAVPIIFHGAVIGCLLAVSKTERNFSPREIQHFRDLSKLSTLSVQSFRENAALDQLNFKFSRILNPTPVEEFDKAIDRVVDLLQDVLDPLATGIWLDVGLQQHVSLKGPEAYQRKLRSRVENEGSDFSGAPAQENDSLDVLMFDLDVKPSDAHSGKSYKIGRFAILVPAQSDVLDRPILGRNPVFLRTVAAHTTSSVLAITMEFLNSVIQEFGVRINNLQPMNNEEWFAEVEAAAAKAGLLWIVAEIPVGNPFLGKPEAMQDARRLQSQHRRGNGRYLRSAPLRLTRGELLIGVQGSSYFNMRNVCPLWKSFFFQFAEMVDSALQRMISNQAEILRLEHEAIRLEHEAARSYEFATIAVTTAEIVHQIVNTTRDISLPLKSLYEAYLKEKLNCVDERMEKLIADLPQHASHLLELTADFKKLSDPKENVKCNLLQAVEQAERLYALQLKKCGIVLETDIPDSLTVGVPPHVAVLALATLVGNSRDAAPNGGHIRIRAWEEGDMVRCDVTDNGHGVPVEVQSRLFRERNVTTKTNGNGWGLYLVSRSLKDRHGSVELTSSHPEETTFTIRFPRYNRGVRG